MWCKDGDLELYADDRTDFTDCFEDSVILLLPTLLFVVFGIPRLRWLFRSPISQILDNSFLYLAKMGFLGGVLLCQVIILMKAVIENNDVVSRLVSPALLIASYFFSLVVLYIEHSQGQRTSHLLSLYWVLSFLAGIFKLRTLFLIGFDDDTLSNTFFLLYMVFLFGLSLSACWPEPKGQFVNVHQQEQSPEAWAPLFSMISFSWMDPLMATGYRKPIEMEDLYPLLDRDHSALIEAEFEKNWSDELKKRIATGEKGDHITLLKALWKSFGFELFFLAGLYKIVQDCLSFTSPLLLGALINFTSDSDQPDWKGYMYTGLIFGAALCQSIALHQYFHLAYMSGMRIKAGVLGAVYRKAFRLSSRARQQSTTGEIVNLMAIDGQRLGDICNYINIIWSGPWQIALALYLLFNLLGYAVIAGLIVMVCMIPVTTAIARRVKAVQVQQMKVKDERIKTINEALAGIKVIKLYAWEKSFIERISQIRDLELKYLQKSKYINCFSVFVWRGSPLLVSVSTFAVYVLSGNDLTPDKAFVALSLFNLLQFPLSMFPTVISTVMEASVSIKRLQKYLLNEELDPNAVDRRLPASGEDVDELIKVQNASFSWVPPENPRSLIEQEEDLERSLLSKEPNKNESTPSSSQPILSNLNLTARRGQLIAIIGQVGSGKSSLLSALLGDMYRLNGSVSVVGSVAYVPQQAWIQNATIQDNILFGRELNTRTYNMTVQKCQLLSDFQILPAGDQTEIGEKGINLSGGQKQRVSIARAVYQNCDVYLFDDPLSALDSHVGKALYDEVIGKRGVLQKKTRIFVTNHLHFLPEADQIIVLKNGSVHLQGTYQTLMTTANDFTRLLSEIKEEEEQIPDEPLLTGSMEWSDSSNAQTNGENSNLSRDVRTQNDDSSTNLDLDRERLMDNPAQTPIQERKPRGENKSKEPMEMKDSSTNDPKPAKDRLITVEGVQTGTVEFGLYGIYCQLGGWLLVAVILFFYATSQTASVGSSIWLSYWSQKSDEDEDEVRDKLGMYLGLYSTFCLVSALLITIGALFLVQSTLRVSVITHSEMLLRILRSPMSFFDTTPLGRIVNRFSKDIYGVDDTIPTSLRSWLQTFFGVISIVVVIGYATPLFLVVIIPLGILYIYIQKYYVATSRQLKRLESVTRSPIYANFSETLTGLSSIRAYRRIDDFINHSSVLMNTNQKTYYPNISSNRWLATRLEFLGNIITLSASLFAVIERNSMDGGTVGLSISYAMSVTQTLNWLVRMNSELETNIVSVERLKEYMEIETEAPPITDLRPVSEWPHQGVISFQNLSLRYRPGTPIILHNLSLDIREREKIGICGRTGAGKSSLTLALFRIVEPDSGTIVIDGLDITKIGLDDLRSKLTIIPQDPVLFGGSVRTNLDPFGLYSDEQIWTSLEQGHLKNTIQNLDAGLDSIVVEGGENFSVGQRQLLCLARALLRKTKILVLDEATAAIDPETDVLIQQTIRLYFSDCTILTIAHRLNTIMDSDRILVLSRGELIEFDTPTNLLANPESHFRSMAHDAGLVD